MNLNAKRITRTPGYARPEKTYQESLTNQEIKEKLKDYKKVSDIRKISIGTHLRYFSLNNKTGEQLFRLGGVLSKIDPEGRFVVLTNGDVRWSVQIGNTIFFQKMNEKEIKEEMRKEIMTEEMGITDNDLNLKKQLKILTSRIEKYEAMEKQYKILLKKNELLSDQLKKIETEIKKEKSKKDKSKNNK